MSNRLLELDLPQKVIQLANHEDAIRRAIRDGDMKNVNRAYAAYVVNMQKHGQKPEPLSYFTG